MFWVYSHNRKQQRVIFDWLQDACNKEDQNPLFLFANLHEDAMDFVEIASCTGSCASKCNIYFKTGMTRAGNTFGNQKGPGSNRLRWDVIPLLTTLSKMFKITHFNLLTQSNAFSQHWQHHHVF